MAIDIRATVTCSLGTLISASISDDYIQGNGLIKTRGSCELSGIYAPTIGTKVTFSYTKNGVTRQVPRVLRVMSSFADPFRRTTQVELGCKLTYLSDLKEPIKWSAFNDPLNRDEEREDSKIITFPIYAISVAAKCLAKLGLASNGLALTNAFSIAEFNFSAGYVSVLSDLLVSENYCGYLDTNEVLQIINLNAIGGTADVFSVGDIIDIAPIGVGQLPGEAVVVSYSSLELKVPEEEVVEDEGEGGGEGGGETPEAPGGIGGEPASPEEAEEQAIINEKINWERTESYGTAEDYYVSYTDPEDGSQRVAEFRGTTSTVTSIKYKEIRFRQLPRAKYEAPEGSELNLIGSTSSLPIYTSIGSTAELPVYTAIGNTASLTAEQQAAFEDNPVSVLEEVWPDADVNEAITDGFDEWVLLEGGWTLNPPTYQEQFEDDPVPVLEEIWPDAELYDYVADGSDKWVNLSGGWTLNPPTYQEQFEEDPTAVLNEIWPAAQVYDYVADGMIDGDKWIHTGSGNWYHEKKALDEDEIYNVKEVPIVKTTSEYGPSIAVASSAATDYLSTGRGFSSEDILISRTYEYSYYDDYGNQVGSVIRKYESGLALVARSSITWADSEDAINLDYAPLGRTHLVEEIVNSNETLLGYTKDTTSTYLRYIHTQNGQQQVAKAVEQAVTIDDMANILLWLLDSGLVHKNTRTQVSRSGVTTSEERPPAPQRINAAYNKDAPSLPEKEIAESSPFEIADTKKTRNPDEAPKAASEVPDPDNGYRTESSSALALAIGNAAAERRLELSLPYAPDDRFIKSANGKYYAIKSNAAAKASAFGRVQNRLFLGNRSGMNIQVAAERMPLPPFAPVVVQANGLSALYLTNAVTYTMSSDGILASTDALFWGGIGGTGTFWFPVAPGITTLPSAPAVVNGQMTVTNVVPVWNETLKVEASTRLQLVATRLPYALGLLTTATVTTRVKLQGSRIRRVAVPAAVGVTVAAQVPKVSISAKVRPPAASVAVAAVAPAVAGGAAVSVPLSSIAVEALVPETVGRPRIEVLVPAADLSVAAMTPAVRTGVSVAVPVKNLAVAGIRPAAIGKLDIEAFDLFLLNEDDLLSLRNP
jgi:hypothetical protein